MTEQSDGWLAAERERHGPVTEDEVHAGYDAVLDARAAARRAEEDEVLGAALPAEPPDPSIPDSRVTKNVTRRQPSR
jgi:hypothetical protein